MPIYLHPLRRIFEFDPPLLNSRLDLLKEGLAFVDIVGHSIVPLAILKVF
jgi:hypothetical protein